MFFGETKNRYRVCTYGNEILTRPSVRIEAVDESVRALAESMKEAVRLFNGIGLAAPQVGENIRLVVFDVPTDSVGENPTEGERMLLPQMPFVAVNPEIVSFSDDLVPYNEGCLSVPNIFADVLRPSRVVLRTGTLDGRTIECECGGVLGRCIQHELDHLDGKLFIDRLTPEIEKTVRARLKSLYRYGERHHFERVVKA